MFFSKKSDKKNPSKEEIVITEGITNQIRRLPIRKLITKLGGVKNIEAVESNANRIDIKVKDKTKINIMFFRTSPAIINLFYKEQNIGFLVGEKAAYIVKDIKEFCNIK